MDAEHRLRSEVEDISNPESVNRLRHQIETLSNLRTQAYPWDVVVQYIHERIPVIAQPTIEQVFRNREE